MLSDSYMSTLSLLMAYHVLGSNCFDTSFQQSAVHIENCMANLTNQINVGIQAQNRFITNTWFWDAVSENRIITHCFGKFHPEPAWCEIKTLEGTMVAKAGEYIIRGVAGEIYPCKQDIFEKTYEEVKADGGNAGCG